MLYRRAEWCGRGRTSISARGRGQKGRDWERERRGRQSAQHLSTTRKRGTAGQAQEETLCLSHTRSKTYSREAGSTGRGQSRRLVRDGGECTPPAGRQVHSGPGKKKQESTGQGSPKVLSWRCYHFSITMGEWTILERLLEAAVQQHSTMIGR